MIQIDELEKQLGMKDKGERSGGSYGSHASRYDRPDQEQGYQQSRQGHGYTPRGYSQSGGSSAMQGDPTQDADLKHYITLAIIHARNAAHYQRQYDAHSAAHVPPVIAHGRIDEAENAATRVQHFVSEGVRKGFFTSPYQAADYVLSNALTDSPPGSIGLLHDNVISAINSKLGTSYQTSAPDGSVSDLYDPARGIHYHR